MEGIKKETARKGKEKEGEESNLSQRKQDKEERSNLFESKSGCSMKAGCALPFSFPLCNKVHTYN